MRGLANTVMQLWRLLEGKRDHDPSGLEISSTNLLGETLLEHTDGLLDVLVEMVLLQTIAGANASTSDTARSVGVLMLELG